MSTRAHLALAADPDREIYRQLGIDDPDRGRLLHVLFSHKIGDSRGSRSEARNWLVALAGMGRLAYRRSDGSVEDATVPNAPTSGFPNGASVFAQLGRTPGEVDRMWRLAVATDGVHATLPLDLLIAFFPAWAWKAANAMISWGPGATTERLERFAQLEAMRPIKPTRARPKGGTISKGTIDKLLSNAKGLMGGLVEMNRREYPADELTAWVALPHVRRASELGALAGDTDRSAPTLMLVRRVLRGLNDDIQRRRQTAEGRGRLNRRLRLRLLIALLAVTGARILALSRVRVCDFDRAHRFPGGEVGPAMRLFPGKRLDEADARWKALPEEVATWVEETIDHFRLDPADCIWRSDKTGLGMTTCGLRSLLTGTLTPDGRNRIRPALPRDDNRDIGYSPHTLRHLAEQLAFSVGHDYLAENPRERTEITPQVLADALLDHSAMSDDHLGYKDLASIEGRERYARIAALGIWEYIWGDRGARHAPDRERIEQAAGRRDEVRAEQAAVETRIADLRTQRKAIEARGRDAETLPGDELVRLVFGLSAVAGSLDDEYQEAADVQRRLTAAEQELRAAHTELVPIPDDAPDPELIEVAADDRPEEVAAEPVRDWLLLAEAARAFAVSKPTMRRWFRGVMSHPLDGDPRNPWQRSEIGDVIETHSSRKRRLVVSRLDRSRIAPEVMRAINEMLLHPPR